MIPSRPRHLFVEPPETIDPRRYYLCMLGPLGLSLSLTVQVMTVAFLLLGPSNSRPFEGQLSEYGKYMFRPEHDLAIYVAGLVLAVAAALACVWWWRRWIGRIERSQATGGMTSAALLLGSLAPTSLLAFLSLVSAYWFSHDPQFSRSGLRGPYEPLDALRMLVPAVMAFVCAVLDSRRAPSAWGKPFNDPSPNQNKSSGLLRWGVPILLVLILGVPPGAANYLAGQIFLTDMCYHWNFFAMGPALSFLHGKAFGTEISSLYGIGWPLVACGLSPFFPLTYGNLVALEILYACIYYVGLFFMLRACLKSELWAAVAVGLALYWEIFTGMKPNEVIWMFPSSNMMRHPMDVWFFGALIAHQRSGKIFWAALVGLTCALGIFFETDTGVYLLATYIFYLILQIGRAEDEAHPLKARSQFLQPVVVGMTIALTLFALLLYASRGTLFTGAFWRGWLEALLMYTSWGLSALPIAELPDAPLICFILMVLVYLAVVVYGAIRALHRSAGRGEVLLATVAAYGLVSLLLFVNRSYSIGLSHVAGPLAVVVVALIFQFWKWAARFLPRSFFPCSLASGLLLLLLSKSEFRRLPSLLSLPFGQTPRTDLSLMSNPTDISGLPLELAGFVQEFRDIASALRSLAPNGTNVAILTFNDTILYRAANLRPWLRHVPIFSAAYTQQYIEGIQQRLIENPPAYVVVRAPEAKPDVEWGDWSFIRQPLYQVVTNRFELRQRVGSYEIWSPANNARAHCLAAELLMSQGEATRAIAEYGECLRLDPNFTDALNNLAWLRATSVQDQVRDGSEAVRLAERACQLTDYRQAMFIGTLAAAYAEAGRFEEAAATAKRARETAVAAGQQDLAQKNQDLIQLFEAHQPYRAGSQ